MAYTTKDEIKAQLDAAGIEYDADANRDELADMLPKQSGGATVTVRVLRAFWPEEDERVEKGSIIDVPIEDALDGVESGMFQRVRD